MNGSSVYSRLIRGAAPLVIVGSVITMVVPVPPAILDILLAANITLAVLALLAVMWLRDTLDLSAFPSLILIATMLRLSLNVSSTRLILLDGYAGKVIQTFGNFVVGGSVVVGLVVFLILVVIQFAVVTSGAGRVAEVAARFALDAMPGKQMAIDADLSAGLIDETEARWRRRRIARESDFYGAMDGASKFVKGDAVAGIVIVLINLVGGLVIGVVSRGLAVGEAVATFSLLTVGDGLVSQIPALLLSVATGLLVSRVGDDEHIGTLLGAQLLGNPQALRVGAAVLAGLALLPGLPKLPFLGIAVALFLLSGRVSRQEKDGDEAHGDAPVVRADPDDPDALIGQLRVDPLELHLSYDILDLIDSTRGGDLLERVRSLRQQIALELGLVMPLVRTRDDVSLPESTYRVLLHGVEVARGTAPLDRVLVLPVGDGSELRGMGAEPTVEPVFGLAAFWVPEHDRGRATATGATVVDRSAVVVTHLAEIVRSSAGELLSRQQVQQLVEGLRMEEPLLANEIGTESLPLPLLHAVLRGLLEERVPVRDLPRIVEAVSIRARDTHVVEQLINVARVGIGSAIAGRVAPRGALAVVTLDPRFETELLDHIRDIDGTLHLVVDPDRAARLAEDVGRALVSEARGELPLALVCGQMLRRPLRRTLATAGVDVPVLAYPELPPHLELTQIGAIADANIHV